MRYKVLTVVNIKTAVFWDVVPCCLVENCCLHHQDRRSLYPEGGDNRFCDINSMYSILVAEESAYYYC
jgi:hypothetical protein